MKITAGRKRQIANLAAALADIAPATTPGSGFCVEKVAREMGLKRYWKNQRNKRTTIAHLLEQVFRYHPRKPKKRSLSSRSSAEASCGRPARARP